MLDAIRASGGRAIAGEESRILGWMRRCMSIEGISICPESAICLDCLWKLCAAGDIQADEEVIVFNTGAAQKYPEVVSMELPRVDKDKPLDFDSIEEQ